MCGQRPHELSSGLHSWSDRQRVEQIVRHQQHVLQVESQAREGVHVADLPLPTVFHQK